MSCLAFRVILLWSAHTFRAHFLLDSETGDNLYERFLLRWNCGAGCHLALGQIYPTVNKDDTLHICVLCSQCECLLLADSFLAAPLPFTPLLYSSTASSCSVDNDLGPANYLKWPAAQHDAGTHHFHACQWCLPIFSASPWFTFTESLGVTLPAVLLIQVMIKCVGSV